ncbi:MAG: hypothetical protein GTO45_03480 [Candidatus Aminicenantes bacterium]|nr:hypothetical protein [Candidatus Aminicenantes bacterium]NIM77787.1 hypothetical protein [Candidatus Aminicenantes bacterium]NIN17100.1 hypothetical protein [Candidatus Aminicenantes bacterium]NIN40993.1 hypothetical protein [Candidatus Aminicenantes bacterium]NIN83798.1 hypothetical protein [Candidatus Aminicenantes bacterium]
MKIKLTPAALMQMELVAGIHSNETGFIIGQRIGKHTIIENLFPVNFDENTIDDVYARIYNKLGDKLLGVFFNNKEPFFSDWFIEDMVIRIKSPQPEFYLYDADNQYIRLPQERI